MAPRKPRDPSRKKAAPAKPRAGQAQRKGVLQRIAGPAAWAAMDGNPAAAWPRRTAEGSRIEPLAKPQFAPGFHLVRNEKVFVIGTDFARALEIHLHRLGFELPTLPAAQGGGQPRPNELLNRHTPFSILNELRWALDPETPFDTETAFQQAGDDEWLDLQLVSAQTVSLERALDRRREITETFRAVRDCRAVIITFGLAEAWWDGLAQRYLNRAVSREDAEKSPGRYEYHLLGYEAVRDCAAAILELLRRHGHPELRVLLAVSPEPLAATFRAVDVAEANAYSKSVLRAVAEEMRQRFDFVDYFPLYESVALSDRALAWEDDLLRATPRIIDQNVVRLVSAYAPGLVEEDDEYLFNLGLASERQRNFADAEARFRRVLELKPERHDAARHLGFVLAQLERLDDAHEWLERSLSLRPRDPWALYHLGVVCRRQGRLDQAVHYLGMATAIDSTNAGAFYQLAICLAEQKEMEKALAAISKAIAISPHVDALLNRRVSILVALKRFKQAEADARRAVTLAPTRAVYHHVLAGVLFRLGNLKDALIHQETAHRLEPANDIYKQRLAALRAIAAKAMETARATATMN